MNRLILSGVILTETFLYFSPNSCFGTVTVPNAASALAETWSSATRGAVRRRKSAPFGTACGAASRGAPSTAWHLAVGFSGPSTGRRCGSRPPAPSSCPRTVTSCPTSPSSSSLTLINGARPTSPPSLTCTFTSTRRTYSSLAARSRWEKHLDHLWSEISSIC